MAVKDFLTRFVNKFMADDTTTLAASLAFYTAFSLAPLLILFVSVTARLDTNLQQGLIGQVQGLAGADAAKTVASVIHGAKAQPRLTSLAGIAGVVTLLLSASLIFGQLRATLNRILNIPPATHSAETVAHMILAYVHGKLLTMLIAVAFILLMIASVLISTIATVFSFVQEGPLAMALNAVISAAVYVFLFTLLFHFLPDRHMKWKCALQGGAITAILFVIGKELIGLYLGSASLGTAYGAAGSVIVLLVWVYYSALITFVGAQVSSLLGNNAPGVPTGAH